MSPASLGLVWWNEHGSCVKSFLETLFREEPGLKRQWEDVTHPRESSFATFNSSSLCQEESTVPLLPLLTLEMPLSVS